TLIALKWRISCSITFKTFAPRFQRISRPVAIWRRLTMSINPDGNTIASCEYFNVDCITLPAGSHLGNPNPERFSIVTVVSGTVQSGQETHHAGDFLLLPRGAKELTVINDAELLQTTIPRST
ncbi:MAG: hypothetical protein ACPGUY_09540, partial [Akkermansiaceae bacterium]